MELYEIDDDFLPRSLYKDLKLRMITPHTLFNQCMFLSLELICT